MSQISQDCTDLSLRIQKIDADIKSLRLEWTDTYDKVYKVLDRFRKRWDREAAQRRREEATEEASEGANGVTLGSSQDILAYARQRGLLR